MPDMPIALDEVLGVFCILAYHIFKCKCDCKHYNQEGEQHQYSFSNKFFHSLKLKIDKIGFILHHYLYDKIAKRNSK